ncbi:MAG: xanthine dehydrogenase family protein [Thermotogaceae bacterium]|nr:xanthine dehydrogenase family protein [Thermotogaceae bacterium]
MKIVGKHVARLEGKEKAYGLSKYVGDLYFDRMLYAGVFYSPIPHGILERIYIEDAERVPGIVKVATYKDIPGENQVGLVVDDMPLLVPEGGKVRFEGDAIALVAGESQESVEEALKKIKIDYRPLKGVFSIEEAIESDIVVNGEKNVAFHRKIRRGNVKKALDESYLVVEMDFKTNYQEHVYLETQGAIAVYEENGAMTIYGSFQCPYYVQKAVARVLGMPLNKVNVVQTETGGAFGGKEDVPSYVATKAALLSYLTKRPVKLIYKREDDIRETSKRHPSKSRYAVGFTRDGKITAVKAEIYLDMGAYATLSPIVMYRSMTHACGAYEVKNVHIDVYGVYTNKVPSGAFRGFGSPQVLFAMESVMDEAAERLGMDKWDIRYLNSLDVGKETSTGHLLRESVGARKTLINVKKISSYDTLKKEVEEFNRKHVFTKRGLGWSHIIYGVSLGAGGQHLDASGAEVHVHGDGTVNIMIGGTEMGQGAKTVMAMVASEILGQRLEKIEVLQPETKIIQDSGPTVASRTTLFSGNAVKIACEKILNNILDFICKEYDVGKDKIKVEYGYYVIGNEKVPFDEIARMAENANVKLAEMGWFVSPKLDFDMEKGVGEAYIVYSFATQLSLVEVDLLTGKPKVLKVWVSHDIGKAINPDGVIGQIHGGVVQGMGYAVMENLVVEKGRIISNNFNNYLIPTVRDVPEIVVDVVEEEYSKGPFGAKGIGEPSLMSSPPSVANAISDALKIRMKELPITPEKILLSLKEV